jgi:hypothetical protein
LKPLYLRAKVEKVDVGRVFVNNRAVINIFPLCMLSVIEKSMNNLISTKVALNGFAGKILQVKGMATTSLKVGSLIINTIFFIADAIPSYNVILEKDWIHANDCIPSNLYKILLL